MTVSVIDSSMHSRNVIKRTAFVCDVTNGNTSGIRHSIKKHYPIEYSQRNNNEVQLNFMDKINIMTNIYIFYCKCIALAASLCI